MRTDVPFNVPAWWLIIMPVLMIILIAIIILIVINIVNTRQKKAEDIDKENKNKNFNEKKLTGWIKKKDLLYWLLIICLGTISLFTFRYKDATEVISHWGFAGTIVSIILAIIAIGFTLFQTLSSNLSSEKIAESADIVYKASKELETSELAKSSEIINKAALDLVNYRTVIELSIGEVRNELGVLKTHQKENFDNIRDSLTSTIYQGDRVNNPSEISDIFEINVKEFFESSYIRFTEEIRAYLYAVMYRGHFSGFKIGELTTSDFFDELIRTTSFYKKRKRDDGDEFSEGLFFGVSIANFQVCSMWLINFEIMSNFQKLSEKEQLEILNNMKKKINEDSVKVIENI